MQSNNEMKPVGSLNQIAPAAVRTAMTGSAGLVALAALFCASLVYVAQGGAFAVEASPLAAAEISNAGSAVMTADAAARFAKASSYSAPAPRPRPDAAGIVNRYEDD